MSCKNTVKRMVPRGYDYREHEYRCGSTGIDGNPVWCSECEGSEKVKRIMANSEADNAWLRSANWGEI